MRFRPCFFQFLIRRVAIGAKRFVKIIGNGGRL